MDLAPIVLFVYNRPWHTEKTLLALSNNELADKSILYIYSDGPKNDREDQIERIIDVRKLIRARKWCNQVNIIEFNHNKGLADSIIDGVTEVINKYGKIIVLEDDVITSSGFLKYMNDALNIYKLEEKVMHISGFMYPHKNKKLPETFFYPLPYPGGGWATWERAWKYFNNDHNFLKGYFDKYNLWQKFNTAGGRYLQKQLELNCDGTLKTWFVKWHASLLLRDGLTLFPNKSLIINTGFDGSGENCAPSSCFNGERTEIIIVKKQSIKVSKLAKKIIIDFYQGQNKRSLNRYLKDLIPQKLKRNIQLESYKILKWLIPELRYLKKDINWDYFSSEGINIKDNNKIKINSPYKISSSNIGDYTYIASNAKISSTSIGKFCSIGPNLVCGWGIHPTNGISTSPMFYSTLKQNGFTLSKSNKVTERKPIKIGNDVFIGANVTILDGITIGDGAVIGAGAVVSKNIPPYGVAVGIPIKIIRYRFSEEQILKLLKIKWWNFDEEKLEDIEKMFFDIDSFIEKYES